MEITPATSVQGIGPAERQDAKLKKACQDFEALLTTQMLSAMRQTVSKTDLFGDREKEDILQSMLDQEMATEMSRTGNMKIADMLYRQLSALSTKTDATPNG